MARDDESFLSRWSRRKVEARSAPEAPQPPERVPVDPPTTANSLAGGTTATPKAPELPPIESLTADSDFSPFMRPDVDAALRRTALKKLLHDPRFNVMDGLDVYIDDYSKPDPLPPEWLAQMKQVARLGDYQPPAEAPPAEEARKTAGTEPPPVEQAAAEELPDPASEVAETPPALPSSNDAGGGSTARKDSPG